MKNPKLLLIMLCAAVFALAFSRQTANAQEPFKLSDYKNPDYTFRSLDFDFNLSSSFSSNKTLEKWNNIETDTYRNYYSISNNLSPAYFALKNSRAYQGRQMASFTVNSHFSRTAADYFMDGIVPSGNVDDFKRDYKRVIFPWRIESENRFYDAKQRFVETNLILDGYLANYKTTTDINEAKANEDKQMISRIAVSIPLLAGIGRIEAVQDARLAIYILDDLEQSGNLERAADHDDILALATFITQIKNERFFDHRLRKISEITAVDSLLEARGLKAKSGASYYTLLNDNWDYAAGPIRESGKRFSAGAEPYYQSRKQQNREERAIQNPPAEIITIDLHEEWLGVRFLADFRVENPLSLRWQHSTRVQASYSILRLNGEIISTITGNQDVVKKYEDNANGLSAFASHAVGYYPNSRTSIIAQAGLFYNQYLLDQFTPLLTNDVFKESLLGANLNVHGNYYFSPQLQFTLSFASNYLFSDVEKDFQGAGIESTERKKSFQVQFMAGFRYSIF